MSISPEARSAFNNILDIDSAGGYHQLTYYLKSIIGNRPIEIDIPGQGLVEINANDAWQLIEQWSLDNEANLPMGDRGGKTKRAKRLLNYLELTVQGKAREAAAAHQAILESVRSNPLKNVPATTPAADTLKRAFELRNAQYQLLQDKYLGKLETAIQQTAFLKRFKSDPYTYSLLSGLLAANASNLVNQPNASALADEIARLTQYQAGNGALNNAAHLAYSTTLRQKGGELDQLIRTIQDITDSVYGDNAKGREGFQKDMASLVGMTHITSLSQIPTFIEYVAPGASKVDKARLASALRSSIVATLDEGYVNPTDILSRAASISGVPSDQLQHLDRLKPLIKEVRYVELHHTATGGLLEQDPRIHATLNLATDIGVSPHIPWLTPAGLDASAVRLIQKYKIAEGETFSNRIDAELKKGSKADFVLISELSQHIGNQAQYRDYRQNVSGNTLYFLRDLLGRGSGTLRSATYPIERFYERTNAQIYGGYAFLNTPFDSFGNWVLETQEKFPILNPAKFVNDKIMGGQLWIAQKILDWSEHIKGTGRWYSGIVGHIGDFSHSFVHSDGQWSEAAFHFVQTKWGNVLDWGAQKAGYASFQAVKAKVGTSLWNGFAKMAPGLAEKMSAGALGKVVGSFMLGELTAGTSLLIQAGLMVVGAGIKKVWQLLTDAAARERFFDKLPFYALAGSLIGGVVAIPSMLVGGLITVGGAIMSGLAFAASSLMSLFIPAMAVAGIALASAFLIFQSLNMTARLDVNLSLDSGAGQFIGSILCDSGDGGGKNNSRIQTAACIVEILSKCGMNPMTGADTKSSKWQCALASTLAASALEVLKDSASNYTYLQCVGFVRAIDVANGGAGSGFGDAKTLLSSPPSGYKPVLGVGSCSTGDFFVDTSTGGFGHVGLFIDNGGATIRCADANGAGNGVIRGPDNCTWLSSKVAGCLKKI